MNVENQVNDGMMNVASTNIATSSSLNSAPAMAPAEKPRKFLGVDFRKW